MSRNDDPRQSSSGLGSDLSGAFGPAAGRVGPRRDEATGTSREGSARERPAGRASSAGAPRQDSRGGARPYRSAERDRPGSDPRDRRPRFDETDRPTRPRRDETLGSRIRAEDIHESWPEIPAWVDRRELGPDVLRDLRTLSPKGAEFVADHLVAAGALADDDPELAWRHARAARSQGGRVAVVRETVGLVAYRAGEWAEAISELRAARRMGGGPGQLPVMADAERALGHPERAIELSRSVEAAALDQSAAAELTIVVAGARSDLGQQDAALVGLRAAAERVDPEADYAARLYYAYADLLARLDRRDDAIAWFIRAADADAEEETDAAERLEELAAGEAGEAEAGGTDGDQIDGEIDLAGDVDGLAQTDAGPDPAGRDREFDR